MIFRDVALLSLLAATPVIASVTEKRETVLAPLAEDEHALKRTPMQKRELDLVQQITYNEEQLGAQFKSNAPWEVGISDDGYTIVSTPKDPNDTDPTNGQDVFVRVYKYKQSKWSHLRGWEQMGQDLYCQYSHFTVRSTPEIGYGSTLSLSGDGKVLALSTPGVGSFQTQVDRYLHGYTDVFRYNEDTKLWVLSQRFDGSTYGTRTGDNFGKGVKLSRDGTGLVLATNSCYRKSAAGGGHDQRTDRARGFEWNESTQNWDLIFSLDKWNGYPDLLYSPCASQFAYVDVLKSKDGTKWYYAFSGYHHGFDTTYIYEVDRNSGTQNAVGGGIPRAQYTQLLEDDNGDLRTVSMSHCWPSTLTNKCWGNTANYNSAWLHHKFDRSTNSWQVVQTFGGTTKNENFGYYLSLSSDGRFLAATNTPNSLTNHIYEFNPNTLQFQDLNLSGSYPPAIANYQYAILPSGDVIGLANGMRTRFVLDPGVDYAGGGGDPHFNAFGGIFFTWQGHCDVILTKTPKFGGGNIDLEIHVRTRKIRKWSAIDAVAFKFGNDIGEIDSNEGKFNLNGANVESLQTETFKVTKKKLKKKIMLYEFVFDENTIFEVKVNTRGQMIFVNLKGMYPEGTVGILGSPHKPGLFSRDGTLMPKKEIDAFVESWQVQDLDPPLFHERRHPQYPSKCLYQMEATQSRGRRRLKETHTVTMEDATAACAAHPPGPGRKFCVEDVYQTGNIDVAEEDFYG